MFPHHEDEIAQSEAATGQPFVRTWLHCAHLQMGGQKMAKRTGNIARPADIYGAGASPRALRYALLAAHYRAPLEFSEELLGAATSAVERLSTALSALDSYREEHEDDGSLPDLLAAARAAFEEALDDDLNISMALAAVFDLVRELNRRMADRALSSADAARAAALLRDLDTVLAVAEEERIELPPDVERLLQERRAARAARDWARSDALRAELAAIGRRGRGHGGWPALADPGGAPCRAMTAAKIGAGQAALGTTAAGPSAPGAGRIATEGRAARDRRTTSRMVAVAVSDDRPQRAEHGAGPRDQNAPQSFDRVDAGRERRPSGSRAPGDRRDSAGVPFRRPGAGPSGGFRGATGQGGDRWDREHRGSGTGFGSARAPHDEGGQGGGSHPPGPQRPGWRAREQEGDGGPGVSPWKRPGGGAQYRQRPPHPTRTSARRRRVSRRRASRHGPAGHPAAGTFARPARAIAAPAAQAPAARAFAAPAPAPAARAFAAPAARAIAAPAARAMRPRSSPATRPWARRWVRAAPGTTLW